MNSSILFPKQVFLVIYYWYFTSYMEKRDIGPHYTTLPYLAAGKSADNQDIPKSFMDGGRLICVLPKSLNHRLYLLLFM